MFPNDRDSSALKAPFKKQGGKMYGNESSVASIVWWIIGGIGILTFLIILYRSFFTVPQQKAYVVMRFGKLSKIAFEGINTKAFFDTILTEVDLRQQQLDLKVETKTQDNIFVDVSVAVQYNVDREKVEDSVFKLENPHQQMKAYICNSVRAKVPEMTLDDFFAKKQEIADEVKKDLDDQFGSFGFKVHTALVVDIAPDQNVKNSLNAISVSLNNKTAAENNAMAAYIIKVKEAEADKKSKQLQGEGIALQRQAIVGGLETSVEQFTNKIHGVTAEQVIALVTVVQQMDMLTHLGGNSKKNILFISADPSGILNTRDSIMQAIMGGNEGSNETTAKEDINTALPFPTPPGINS